MKIVFMGTPDFAVPILKSLIDNFEVSLVLTQPDKPFGRKQIKTPSPVKQFAIANGLKVIEPDKVVEAFDLIATETPDFIVTCAYGQIIPTSILALPRYESLNVHASLLPKYRGAAPIQRAIMANEKETGISIMRMESGLDTGAVFVMSAIPIEDTDNYQSVHDRLSNLGATLITTAIQKIVKKELVGIEQIDGDATYAPKITRADESIDFNQDVISVFNHIRALNPSPGARCELLGKETKLFDVVYQFSDITELPGAIININKNDFSIACMNGAIIVKTLQVVGKSKISSKDFVNSLPK